MNRREAIRKLAAGGAVTLGASAVLSTRDVAYAASAPGTGLTDIPGPSEPLPITSTSGNGNGTVQIGDASTATCASGTLASTFSWRINAYNVSDADTIFGAIAPQFVVKDAGDAVLIAAGTNFSNNCFTCPTPYSPPTSTNATVTLRKRIYINFFGGIEFEVPLSPGDTYDIGLLRSWQCTGAGSAVTAEYRISGSYPGTPTVESLSYNVG